MALELFDLRGNPILPRVITHWGDGAAALTNRDISADLAKLDIALSALRDSLQQKVVKLNTYHTDNLGAGLSEADSFTVPAGKNWRVMWAGARVLKPVGAGAGTHEAYTSFEGTAPNPDTIWVTISGVKAFGLDISSGTLTYYNSGHGIVMAAGEVFKVLYANLTDAIQTNFRRQGVHYIETEEA